MTFHRWCNSEATEAQPFSQAVQVWSKLFLPIMVQGLARAHCALLTSAQLLAKSMWGDGYCVITHSHARCKASVKPAEHLLTPQKSDAQGMPVQPLASRMASTLTMPLHVATALVTAL